MGEGAHSVKFIAMKFNKVLIASGVSLLAFAAVASAAFNVNLTVGSSGADVSALQTWLISKGYHIAAIESGAAKPGYFGSQTQAAVKLYQAANGIPNTGFVGPLTRAALNGTAPVASNCLAGWSSVMYNGTSTCLPPGYTLPGSTPAGTMAAPGTISTPGVVGTLAVSLWSTPSGIVVYKGQSYDVAAYKVQASASDMAIQNLTLDFDVRLWLYASAITIKDDSGAIVGQVNNLNAGNFSELTVGSDYRVSVPVSSYIVRATQIKYLTVNISFLPTSDRSSGTVNVLQSQIRSVDGTGVTDTETNTGGARSFSYQGSGAGSIIVTTDSTSPATGQVQLSTSNQTLNVTQAIFDVKSQSAPSTLQSLNLIVRTTGPGTVSTLFSNIQIQAAGLTYSANTICTDNTSSGCVGTNSTATTSTVKFTNLAIPLPADTYVPVKVIANLAVDTNNALDGTVASTTLAASGTAGGTSNNPSVVDQSFNTLAVNSATFTANNLTFTGSSVTVSNESTTYGNAINNTTTGITTQQFSFIFNLTAGNNPIYVSKTAPTAISTSSAPSGITITTTNFADNDTSGDGSTYFYLAPGQTKTFTSIYSATGSSSNSGAFNATQINFGTSSSALTTGSVTSSDITNLLKAVLFH
jgi:peptidoglycan hydrolase-like protein with peptidoglycan-binding domain